jgi:hypothetical protein
MLDSLPACFVEASLAAVDIATEKRRPTERLAANAVKLTPKMPTVSRGIAEILTILADGHSKTVAAIFEHDLCWVSTTTVRRRLAAAEKLGLVSKEKRGRSNVWRVTGRGVIEQRRAVGS